MASGAFGVVVLVIAAAVLAATASTGASERLRIPAPAFFLLAAAAAADVWPGLRELPFSAVEQVVTVALAVILFDGGMGLGWRRFRGAAAPILGLGTAGTLATAGGVAAAAHLVFGLDWRAALLLGAALAPTDPAVVFSVLGRQLRAGRSRTILEGESGSNDPVSIALLAALLTTPVAGWPAAGHLAAGLAGQLGIGLAVGLAGGWALLLLTRRVPLPAVALHPVRVLAGALAVYGAAAAAGGSGFLAVFVAGLILGDARLPHQREVVRFHAALSSLAEIVAFAILGLTIHLSAVADDWVWLLGLGLAVTLAVVIRPLVAGLLLWPVRLAGRDRLLVAWAGLKGAVPILLGAAVVEAGQPGAERLYEIIFVVVAFSVVVQGGSLPWLARRLRPPGKGHAASPPLAVGAFISAQHGVTCHQHVAANLTTPRAAVGVRGRRHQE